jgi:hypothetical protein
LVGDFGLAVRAGGQRHGSRPACLYHRSRSPVTSGRNRVALDFEHSSEHTSDG